jgi:hypothetical protein
LSAAHASVFLENVQMFKMLLRFPRLEGGKELKVMEIHYPRVKK